jgi:YidC/Oxa1 family membrane protein insertase
VDRKTILAIVLSALVLIFIPMLLERTGLVPSHRTASMTRADSVAAESAASARRSGATQLTTPGVPDTAAAGGGFTSSLGAPGRQFVVSNALYQVKFDTRGARVLGVTLQHLKGADGKPVSLTGQPSVTLELGDDPTKRFLSDAVYETSESTDARGNVLRVRFQAEDTSGLRVVQIYTLDPKRYVLGLALSMDGAVARGFTEYQIRLTSWPLVTERNIQEDVNNLQTVSRVGNDIFRHHYNDLRKQTRVHAGAVNWTSVRSKYFSLAVVPDGASAKEARSGLPAEAPPPGSEGNPTGANPARVASTLILPVPPSGTVHRLLIYAGPNDYWLLTGIGHHLEDLVDLGWRWLLPFSRAILRVMVFLHRFLPNYGLVILVLSALVKVVFHPLTAASMKSMRSMQRIQPEIEKLRKRHENDPQKLNQAVFAMYKENKVNPMGGCLPLVIQMPVLFSLYQVFLHAIELRQAPFVGWINDLSAPDMLFTVMGFPIRILPVIMFGSAWLQQRMTPTDPRQVQTMQLMNVFLLVLFYNLPSGLVLYWTVTNLLTAAQQYLVTHGERPQEPKAA